MAKNPFFQTNFTAGEISPTAMGRFDLAKYENAVKILENFLIHQLGGAAFRPGTVLVNAVKDSTKKTRLISFSYSTIQNYIVEMGNLYFRYYANQGQVVSGPAVETVTPFLTADLFNIHYCQKDDTQYLTHTSYFPQKHTRLSATQFSLGNVPFIRGPFLDTNITHVTLAPSADAGSGITVTAAAPAWAAGTGYVSGPDTADYVTNGGNTYKCLISNVASASFAADLAAGEWVLVGAGNVPTIFQAGHVGSLWRIKSGVVKITAVSNGYTATADVQPEPDGSTGALATGPAAVTDWAEAAFSTVRGYPATAAFHEQRLWYGKSNRIFGSVIGSYDNFKLDGNDNSAALTLPLTSEKATTIRWLLSQPQNLQSGTPNGTQSVESGSTGTSINQANVHSNRDTVYGCAPIRPKTISSYIYYLQSNLFILRELFYNYLVNRQVATDMCLLAPHILRDGLGAVDMDYQQSPNDRIWVVRADGQLAVMTRNPEQDVLGWSRIVAGRTAKGPGLFESVAIFQKDNGDDEVWVIVNRTINGSTVRCVEYFSSEFFTNAWDPIRLDCALTYDVPVTVTGYSLASPVVLTAPAHGFSNGDQVKIDNITSVNTDPTSPNYGMTFASPLNGLLFVVANKTTDTFQLQNSDGTNVDGTLYNAYLSGGQVRKTVSVISGLSFYNGEYVSVQLDGGVPGAKQTYLVSGGQITLAVKGAVAHIGFPYTGTIQMLKPSEGRGKMRRMYKAFVTLYQTVGISIGKDLDNMQPRYFANPNDPLGAAPAPFTGDVEDLFPTNWSKHDEVIIQQTQPLPLFVLSILLKSETEEKE